MRDGKFYISFIKLILSPGYVDKHSRCASLRLATLRQIFIWSSMKCKQLKYPDFLYASGFYTLVFSPIFIAIYNRHGTLVFRDANRKILPQNSIQSARSESRYLLPLWYNIKHSIQTINTFSCDCVHLIMNALAIWSSFGTLFRNIKSSHLIIFLTSFYRIIKPSGSFKIG